MNAKGEQMALTCGPCGLPLRQGAKYLAIEVSEDFTGFSLKIGCEHQPVLGIEAKACAGSAVVFGSGGCFFEWLCDFLCVPECGHGKGVH